MSSLEQISVPERALVIAAHPDDVDFGCAGTVALWTRKQCKVTYVICTNGDKGSEELSLSSQELVQTRQLEQRLAAEVVGVQDVIFLGFPDGELQNTPELRRTLVKCIRSVRPEVVFCQDPGNRAFENPFVSHSDHRACGEASFDAIYPAAGNPRFFPELLEEGLMPHKVKEVLFFATHAPNVWQNITDVMDVKLKALFCHRSQISNERELEEFVRKRLAEAGKMVGCQYAEPFRRLVMPG